MHILLTILLSQFTVQDEGALRGSVGGVNCYGSSISCFIQNGKWVLYVDAGTGSSSYTGQHPIQVSGSTISCLPASGVDGGCLTAGDQNISGVKTFEDGANFDGQGIHLTGPFGFLQQTDGRGLYLRDSLSGGSSSINFFLQTLNTRTAGELLRISNNTSASLILDYSSVLSVNGETAHFLCNGLASGAYCLLAGSNLYLGLGGQLPARYWGHHGAVQVANLTRMTAGFPFEVYNAYSGTGLATDHIFMVGYRGSISTQSNLRSFELMVCDGTDVNPPSDPSNRYSPTPPLGCTPGFESDGGYKYDAGLPDGGIGLCYDWYTATGEGHAQEGEIVLWVDDVNEACQCNAIYYDGGLTSSWRRLSDQKECSPSTPYDFEVGYPSGDDQVPLSTSSTSSVWTTISDCDGTNKALNYRQATNTFACNTFSAGSGYDRVQDEGTDLTQRATLNFVGAVSCVDDTTRTTCTVSGGSGNFLETSQTLAGAGIYGFPITGQTWVTSTSKINCTPYGTTADGLTPEAVAAATLEVSWSDPVVGTGFILWVSNPRGLTGTVRFHCSGS